RLLIEADVVEAGLDPVAALGHLARDHCVARLCWRDERTHAEADKREEEAEEEAARERRGDARRRAEPAIRRIDRLEAPGGHAVFDGRFDRPRRRGRA